MVAPADLALEFGHPAVRRWFASAFETPTRAQTLAWPPIARGESTLLLAPTGSGKTLAAFLTAVDRIMFSPEPEKDERCRVLYVSPLKALGADVERNLRAPIAGISRQAERRGEAFRVPDVGVRTGDTPQAERARMVRRPPDILITTPESLYLLLTSRARRTLRSVDTVIVDEIHSVAASKRGAHLFVSLERLEAERFSTARRPLQRIGLSATQRPLEELARLLGGGIADGDRWVPRPVTIVDAGRKRAFDLTVEVPVEDMARLGEALDDIPSGPASQPATHASIWPSIHPRLVELIRAHRSTLIFANSRRLAERLASAINEVAREELALAHHGSVSKEVRRSIEDRLKRGALPALVATSSLELGIDMGAIDLVIQIEAPPSVASGMQRVGRSGHRVGATARGIIFPKFRGDLLACAAVTERMHAGVVEPTLFPRNPLDVLAQQLVAEVSQHPMRADEAFALLRRAAPFAELPRSAFDGVLDMLSGRYPSDEFAELRPRITWDRVMGTLEPRRGAHRIAVVNGGTIPDRGLYGVFLAGTKDGKSVRVGELDEEMVFESRPGDVFLLGASSWRIEDITHDRVTVVPAPGEPGRMPFWHGDRPGRSFEFGEAIGALGRRLSETRSKSAPGSLLRPHGLDRRAAENLIRYIEEQREATGEVPSDRAIIFECFVDEVGDWRVCVLSPFGARVHAPWATAVLARLEDELGAEIDVMWSDDGLVFRLPEADDAPRPEGFFPAAEEVEALVVHGLVNTALFAAQFRENAERALLFPKRNPQKRSPLWAIRRKARNLMSVAARYDTFPVILETYRSCLQDIFDLPSLKEVLRRVEGRHIRVHAVRSRTPSPFASALLFSYVAQFIYDSDAPLAERRAQILSVDHAQLRELLGEAELRALFDREVIDQTEARLQRLDLRRVDHPDALHDLLLALGDLRPDEVAVRTSAGVDPTELVRTLVDARRAVPVRIAGELRIAAAEDAGRLRDALGVVPPAGLPAAFLEPVPDPWLDLVSRFARTHGPFTAARAAGRFGTGEAPVVAALERLALQRRVVEGEFLPEGRGREWCDAEVLKTLKRIALARLRRQVEPVDPAALARFLVEWHGLDRRRRGLDGLLSAVEQLQGAPVPYSALETEILPARVAGYRPSMLDELCAAGEVMWRGFEPIGPHDGRIALYLPDHFAALAPPRGCAEGPKVDEVREVFNHSGALFFADLSAKTGVFVHDLAAALWALVFSGELTNDTLQPLRALVATGSGAAARRVPRQRTFRSRRLGPPGTEGRWSLLADPRDGGSTETARRAALCQQLLERHGVLTREAVHAENLPGGFSSVYPVLKGMEEAGRARRGYFVEGLGATQFALPGAEARLRHMRAKPHPDEDRPPPLVVAATDPANPYGAALAWPDANGGRPQRAAGAQVILQDGRLLGHLGRSERSLVTFLPEAPEARDRAARAVVRALAELAGEGRRRALLIARIDGILAEQSALAPYLREAGFTASSKGFIVRRPAVGTADRNEGADRGPPRDA